MRRGGCGFVYKGDLADGREVFIIKIESRGLNEFQAEVDVLTKVMHRHLVTLLAYCMNGHERFLVYEYMPQGTLSQRLFNYDRNYHFFGRVKRNGILAWYYSIEIHP